MAKKKAESQELTMLRRCFKFRAYPNKGTRRRLFNVMRRAATPVWNACVAEREAARESFRAKLDEACSDAVYGLRRDLTDKEEKAIRSAVAKEVHWPTAYDQYKHVRKSDHPEYAPYSASMLECTIAKVDSSEKSFLALWTKGHTDARPPRQTNMHHSLRWRKSGWKLDGNRLWLLGIGWLKIKMHRPILGKIKTVEVNHTRTGKWFVSFSCEIADFQGPCGAVPPVSPYPPDACGKSTIPSGGTDPEKGGTHNSLENVCRRRYGGTDPEKGGTHNTILRACANSFSGNDPERPRGEAIEITFPSDLFIWDSEGLGIPHPAFYASEAAELARLNQSLARKHIAKAGEREDGSFRGRNRRKAKRLVSKWHEHIANKREHWLWHVARFYAMNYKTVIANVRPVKEKIQYAVASEEALRLCDGAYAKFVTMLRQKCQEFKTEFIERKGEWYDRDKEQAGKVKAYEENKVFVREAKRAIEHGDKKVFSKLAKKCRKLRKEHAV